MENTVVRELNALLKGNYMAIHGYEKFIQNVKDPDAKSELQRIQQEHKENAALIAERIQNLGGVPEDGAGLMGNMGELMNSLKGISGNPIYHKGCIGERGKGIKMAEEIVRGDMDQESRKL